jgi:glycine betaine/choline ABC-type transport system substrate-binding protein
LSGKFTNAKMQVLNYLVDVEHKGVAQVAEGFLKESFTQRR